MFFLLQAVKKHTELDCKCHGVSGSCQVKTCWKVMSQFSVVGAFLRERYHSGIQVTVDQSGNELVKIMADGSPAHPPRDNLVFLEESPDYCVPNTNTGSLGTTGRVCNKSTPGHGSCGILCCGRGFDTIQVEEVYKCSCKFNWCCYVKCHTCRRTVDKHVCKSPDDNVYNGNGPHLTASVANPQSNSQNRPAKKLLGDKRNKRRKERKNRKRGASSLSTNSLSRGDRENKKL